MLNETVPAKLHLRRISRAAASAFLILLVLAAGTSCPKRGGDGGGAVTSEEERKAIGEAVMMLGLAGEDVIRQSAVEVDSATLAADPKAWQGKWVYFDSEVVWVQDREGNALGAGARPDEKYVYWLRGPVALKPSGDETVALAPGASCRAYGRVIEASVSGMGLAEGGKQALAGMDGGTADTVAFFMAKWVE